MARAGRLAVAGLLACVSAVLAAVPGGAAAPAPRLQRAQTTPPLEGALAQVRVESDLVELEFPERVTFSLELGQADVVTGVVLEYGVEQLTCAPVVAKAFPPVEAGRSVSASWTWEMLQSGSQPPGAQVWWQWRLLGAAGEERVTERQVVTWLDDDHNWESLREGPVALHWYRGGQDFGETLHAAALEALADLAVRPGLVHDAPIDLYIYGSSEALEEAVLYEPGWTGGLAYAEHSIVLIGIAPGSLEWGQRTVAHELAHVLVGHYTFSCLGYVPTWLNEGLAVYAEGGPEPHWQSQLDDAVAADELIPLQALNGGFAEDPAQADLSYVQAYSVVNFLIEAYGAEALMFALAQLRDGAAVEDALQAAYGFGLAGLEAKWRASIGAEPAALAQATATPQPTPTEVPTLQPLDGIPVGPTVAPTRARPLPTAIVVSRGGSRTAGLALGALLACGLSLCAGGGLLSLGGLLAWRIRRRR